MLFQEERGQVLTTTGLIIAVSMFAILNVTSFMYAIKILKSKIQVDSSTL